MTLQHLLFTATLILCSVTKPSIALDVAAYKNSQKLDDGLSMYWNVNGDEARIQFAVTGKTAGYIAIGLSEVGAMSGSDIMFGTVSNGKAMVVDAFAYNKSIDENGLSLGVMADAQQDIKTISGEQYTDANGDTWTTLEFSRLLNTSDCNDRPILEGASQVIWAMGSTANMMWHGPRRGGMHLAFLGETFLKNEFPPHDEELNITVQRYNVPSKYTTYTCTTFNLSAMLPTKRHSLGSELILNTNVPATVHHFIIYTCVLEDEIADAMKQPPNRDCTESGPSCSNMAVGWAVGGKALVLPDNVGLPFGPGTPNNVVVLEMHYTNPEGRTDIWDESGVRLPLSPKLLPIEAGTFATGVLDQDNMIRIPPNEESWLMENSCTPDCTAKWDNITIIGSFLHQHLLGKQLRTTLKRNGKEVATLGHADYYAFDFQQWIQPPKPVVMYPGDEIHTVCTWDSRSRNTTTSGGLSTLQEMCLSFQLYYPLSTNLLGGCGRSCASPRVLQEMRDGKASLDANPFSPFSETGAVFQVCTASDPGIVENATCEYGDMNGRSEILPKLHGCPAKSISRLSADVQGTLEVPSSKRSQSSAFGCRSSIGNILIVGGMNCLFVVLVAHLLQ